MMANNKKSGLIFGGGGGRVRIEKIKNYNII